MLPFIVLYLLLGFISAMWFIAALDPSNDAIDWFVNDLDFIFKLILVWPVFLPLGIFTVIVDGDN